MGILLALLSACRDPDVKVRDLHGRTHNLSHPQAPTLLVYWADWCHHCRDEVPELNSLSDAMPILGVYYMDEPEERLNPLVSDFGMTYPVLRNNPARALSIPDVTGVPAHYLITPAGNVLGPRLGSQSTAAIEAWVAEIT